MKTGAEILSAEEGRAVRVDVTIVLVRRTPVEGGGHEIATLGIFVAVATEFGDVYLARSGPYTIVVLFRHHPDRWP